MSKKSNSKNPIKNLPFIIAWTIPVLLWILFYFFLETATDRGGYESMATSDRLKFLLLPLVYWTYVMLVVRFYNFPSGFRNYMSKGCITSFITFISSAVVGSIFALFYEPLIIISVLLLIMLPIIISRKFRLKPAMDSNGHNESIEPAAEKPD